MVYDKIRELCRKKGVTVTQAEKDLGVGKGSLCKIDRHMPSYKKLSAIAEYFGVTPEELTGGHPGGTFYTDEETARKAQQMMEAKKMLFEAAEQSAPEDILAAARFLERMKGTNPYG